MPEETRRAIERENRVGPMKRVVRDRGIFPAGNQAELDKAAVVMQEEANVERAKLLAARIAQAVHFEGQRDDVLQGHVAWVRERGRWRVRDDNMRGGDAILQAARKGMDLLNETPFDFDRPEGERPCQPRALHAPHARVRVASDAAQTAPGRGAEERPATAGQGRTGRGGSTRCSRSCSAPRRSGTWTTFRGRTRRTRGRARASGRAARRQRGRSFPSRLF